MLRRSFPLRRIGIFPLHLDPPNIDHHRVFLQILNDPELRLNRLILLPLSHPAVSLAKSLHLAAMGGLCLREFDQDPERTGRRITECGKVINTSSPQAFAGTDEELEETKNSFVSTVGVDTIVDSWCEDEKTSKRLHKRKQVRVDVKFNALEMHEEKIWVVEQLLRQQFFSSAENAQQYINMNKTEDDTMSSNNNNVNTANNKNSSSSNTNKNKNNSKNDSHNDIEKLLKDEEVVFFQWLADVEVGGCLADRLWPRISNFAPKLPLTVLIPTGPAYPPVEDAGTESTIKRITNRWAGTVNVFNVQREWSSGYVRRRLFEQEGKCNALVSPSILRYIDSHNLYRDERRPRQRYGAAVVENAMRLPLISHDDVQASYHHQRHKTSSILQNSNQSNNHSSNSNPAPTSSKRKDPKENGNNSSSSTDASSNQNVPTSFSEDMVFNFGSGNHDTSMLDEHSSYYDQTPTDEEPTSTEDLKSSGDDNSNSNNNTSSSTNSLSSSSSDSSPSSNNNNQQQQKTSSSSSSATQQAESWDNYPSSSYMSSNHSYHSQSGIHYPGSHQGDGLYHSSKPDPSSKWVSYAGTIPKLELHYDQRNSLARHIYEQLKTFQVCPGEHPDLIVPIGGDGYLMKCVRRFWSRFIPFFGVNAGHVGFLLNDAALLEEFFLAPLRMYQVSMLYCVAENLSPDNEHQQKELMMRKQYLKEKKLMMMMENNNNNNNNSEEGVGSPIGLEIDTKNFVNADHSTMGTAGPCAARDPGIVRAFAFNDAWMERATGQTAKFRICVNGVERSRSVRGDGVLVSTASGSTAYAQALGGSPMPIDTPLLQLVGSNCTWPVRWRPVHLPEDVSIELDSLDSEKRPCRAYVDSVDLGLVKRLTIRASRVAGVQLAFTRSSDVQAKLYKMQFPEQ